MSKLLLIGSHQNKYNSNDIGGVSILFELLVSELTEKKISFSTIDTLVENNGGTLKTLFLTYYRIIKNISNCDHISLHATKNSFLTIAPFILFFSKVFNKPFSIRLFGGNFGDVYHSSGVIRKKLMTLVLKHSDATFFELNSLVDEFGKYNSNIFWFPNVRSNKIQNIRKREFNEKFVYIGTINKEKGIDDICKVIEQLDPNITCDLYGPIKYKQEKYSKEYFKKLNISYKGELKPTEVQSTMDKYDVLLLPSYREGYPGVIIEAFALGIPVIATKLPGILEMCEDKKNG